MLSYLLWTIVKQQYNLRIEKKNKIMTNTFNPRILSTLILIKNKYKICVHILYCLYNKIDLLYFM